MWLRALTWTAASVLGACGDGGGGAGVDGGDTAADAAADPAVTITPEELCEARVAACEGLVECCEGRGYTIDQALCESLLRDECEEDNQRGVEHDRVFHGDRAARCASAVSDFLTSCDPELQQNVAGSCSGIWEGRSVPGEPCVTNEDCAPLETADLDCRDSVCVEFPYVGPGESCEVTETRPSPCPPGYYCDHRTDVTCQPRKEDGETCSSSLECSSSRCIEGTCASDDKLEELCQATAR